MVEKADAEVQRQAMDDGLRNWVLARFGANSPEAHDFGYSGRKVSVKSAETKAQAAQLNKATRKARGTVSKKEKLGANPLVSTEDSVDLRVVA